MVTGVSKNTNTKKEVEMNTLSRYIEDIVYYDLETTGLEAKKNGIVQIAMLFEKNGEVVDAYESKIDCSSYQRDVAVSPKALEINGIKLEDIPTFPKPIKVIMDIEAKLYKYYGNKKVKLCGFNNTSFDKYFLEEFYLQANSNYDKYFHYKQLDVFEGVKMLQYLHVLPDTFNQRLVTLLDELGIDTTENIAENAHDAMYDVEMTRKLLYYIKEVLHDNDKTK